MNGEERKGKDFATFIRFRTIDLLERQLGYTQYTVWRLLVCHYYGTFTVIEASLLPEIKTSEMGSNCLQ